MTPGGPSKADDEQDRNMDLLEEDVPVTRLLKLSNEICNSATAAKAKRPPMRQTAREVIRSDRCSNVTNQHGGPQEALVGHVGAQRSKHMLEPF